MAQINKPSDYFNTKLYTGNGSTNAITGVGFQPDWVWIKNRDAGNDHNSYDSIRGATKDLNNNTTNAESTIAEGLKSFDSNGFTVGTNTAHNSGNENYVSWNWLAGGTASSNTDGSITSSVSANTTAGFSIVSYTGSGTDSDTVGHGLGSAPKMIILKKRDALDNWYVMHTSLSTNNALHLDTTNAQRSTSILTYGVLSTSPTSSVFSFAAGGGAVPTGNVNNSGSTYIAYCFAEKKGFSKFGSYTGNGNTDGTFVYTGFKPAFVIYKGASGANAADNWEMVDNKRSVFNGVENVLYPNLSNAEGTGVTTRMDLLSNGFKMRTSGTDYNGSGQTYIYMAFAEEPLVGTNNIPATAR